MSLWLLVVIAIFSCVMTGLLRHYALSRELMDVPNERSSHTVPTPRGGGMAVVVSFLVALLVLFVMAPEYTSIIIGLGGAGLLIALIGFMDDHGHIAARWRLLAHFIGAGWLLYWLGGLPPIQMVGISLELGWLGNILAALYLVWLLNLYNFMDGIDGLASIEAITVCCGGALIYLLLLDDGAGVFFPLLLAAAVLGFLVWNFPQARIFMGDAGSGFLGFTLGALSLHAAWMAPQLLWCWIILLGVFIVDASVTLLRRVLRGDKFYEAHRSHAYQYASRRLASHKAVSLTVGLINIVWLFPVALLVGLGWMDGFLGALVAYLPLICLSFHFKAGAKELQDI